jgi:hypothetical protein
MATKDQLAQFAADHGIDVPVGATKAEIADAITGAGYDPDSIDGTEAAPMADDEGNGTDNGETTDDPVSTQAQFSTYEAAPEDDIPDTNPPPGPVVYQTLGPPNEGPVPK